MNSIETTYAKDLTASVQFDANHRPESGRGLCVADHERANHRGVLALEGVDGAEALAERPLRAVAHAGTWAAQRAICAGRD